MSIPGGIRMLEEGQWISFKDGHQTPERLTKPLMVVYYENISDFGVKCLFVDLEGIIYTYIPRKPCIESEKFYYNFKQHYQVQKHDPKGVIEVYGTRLNELIDHALNKACVENIHLRSLRSRLNAKFIK